MGLFLQKTNIIRDYLENYVEGRPVGIKPVGESMPKINDLMVFSETNGSGSATRFRSMFEWNGNKCTRSCSGLSDIFIRLHRKWWLSRLSQNAMAIQKLLKFAKDCQQSCYFARVTRMEYKKKSLQICKIHWISGQKAETIRLQRPIRRQNIRRLWRYLCHDKHCV